MRSTLGLCANLHRVNLVITAARANQAARCDGALQASRMHVYVYVARIKVQSPLCAPPITAVNHAFCTATMRAFYSFDPCAVRCTTVEPVRSQSHMHHQHFQFVPVPPQLLASC